MGVVVQRLSCALTGTWSKKVTLARLERLESPISSRLACMRTVMDTSDWSGCWCPLAKAGEHPFWLANPGRAQAPGWHEASEPFQSTAIRNMRWYGRSPNFHKTSRDLSTTSQESAHNISFLNSRQISRTILASFWPHFQASFRTQNIRQDLRGRIESLGCQCVRGSLLQPTSQAVTLDRPSFLTLPVFPAKRPLASDSLISD